MAMIGPQGVAPPPMPGARVPGPGGMKRNAKGVQAARLLLEWIEDAPEIAKDVHPIVDRLTKVIRQSVAPTKPPASARGTEDLPSLDVTPPGGAESGTGSNTASLLAQMAGSGA